MPNKLAFHLGMHSGRRLSPDATALALGLRLEADDVLRLWEGFGFHFEPVAAGHELVTIMLASKHRTLIGAEATRRGLDMPELCGLVLATVVRDDLFAAVVDG